MRDFTLSRAEIIPRDAEPVLTGLAAAGVEIYKYTARNGKPAAIGFFGKANKPCLHTYYRDEAAREKAIAEQIEAIKATLNWKAERKANQVLTENPLKVGDILTGSWGWEQTNPEAWQVVEVKGLTVLVGAIAFESVRGNSSMSDFVRPVKDQFCKRYGTGEPEYEWKRVQTYNGGKSVYLAFKHYQATLWAGTDEYRSWYA